VFAKVATPDKTGDCGPADPAF